MPPEDSFDVARKVKEMYCYTSSDIVKVTFSSFFLQDLVTNGCSFSLYLL